jgi:hypothetical protein
MGGNQGEPLLDSSLKGEVGGRKARRGRGTVPALHLGMPVGQARPFCCPDEQRRCRNLQVRFLSRAWRLGQETTVEH